MKIKLRTTLRFAILYVLFTVNLIAQNKTKKTEVLILGTYHLSQVEDFEIKMLDNVVLKLEAFDFDAICIEKMPGELINDIQSRKDSAYEDLLEYYEKTRLSFADSIQKKLGIGFVKAEKRTSDVLKKESLTDRDRVKLIEYSIASSDLYTATLQYEYIKDKSMLRNSNLNKNMMETLSKYSGSSNEIFSLALRISQNQNIQKLELIDNMQDESFLYKHFPAFIQDYTDNQDQFKDIVNAPVFLKIAELLASGVENKDLLDLYLFMNSEAYKKQDFEAQHAIWLKTHFESGTDRARYSLWEMRNLQMTANILRVCAFYPGKRIVVIIGASHKSFIEKYLKQIPDIELLEFK